jgi:hypothetical protein
MFKPGNNRVNQHYILLYFLERIRLIHDIEIKLTSTLQFKAYRHSVKHTN